MGDYIRVYVGNGRGTALVSNGGPTLQFVPEPPPPPPATTFTYLTRARGRSIYTEVPSPTSRDLLVAGVDMPTRATAGCVNRGVLTEQSADISYAGSNDPAAPLVITNRWFTGKVSVTSGYVDFKNCQLNGNPVTVGALLQCTNAAVKRVRLYDCDLFAQNPQWDTPAVKGHHVELYRCYVRGCTDGVAHIGIGANGTATGDYSGIDQGIVVQQCLLELMAYLSPDQGAAGGLPDNASHLDLIVQFRGGRNLTVWGNRALAYYDPTIGQGGVTSVNMPNLTDGGVGTHVTGDKYNTTGVPTLQSTSAFMFSPILGTMGNVSIRENWIAGGACIVNFAGHTSVDTGGGFGIEVLRNRVARGHRVADDAYWLASATLPITLNGNVEWAVNVWGGTPSAPVYLPDAYGTVTTTPANQRTKG